MIPGSHAISHSLGAGVGSAVKAALSSTTYSLAPLSWGTVARVIYEFLLEVEAELRIDLHAE